MFSEFLYMFTCVITIQFKIYTIPSFQKAPSGLSCTYHPLNITPILAPSHRRLILPVFELHINGLIKYLLFGVCLLLLNAIL